MASEFHVTTPHPGIGSPDRIPAAPAGRPRAPRRPPLADASFGPDAPVRVEVAMPRDLYDRLTDHDDAPRCRYDMATGRAKDRKNKASIAMVAGVSVRWLWGPMSVRAQTRQTKRGRGDAIWSRQS